MRMPSKKTATTIALATGLCCTSAAKASNLVFDVVNATQNAYIKAELASINKALSPAGAGETINYYSEQIDNSTKSIQLSTEINTTIDNEFTWIISNASDDIVPIPREVSGKLDDILHGQTSDQYAAQFRTAKYYVDNKEKDDFEMVGLEGSRARKAANDALLKSIEMDQIGLKSEAVSLKTLGDKTKLLSGHARQLQVANAVAGLQADQLMKLRSMMLVSEAARAAEAQASADKEARAIATSKAMRAGITAAREQTIANQPKY